MSVGAWVIIGMCILLGIFLWAVKKEAERMNAANGTKWTTDNRTRRKDS